MRFLFFFFIFIFSLVSTSEIINGETQETFRDLEIFENPNLLARSTRPRQKVSENCSDEKLRKIMHENISEDGSTESKRSLQAVFKDRDGVWSIICAPCSFSYLAHSHEYCVHSRFGVTCLVFRDIVGSD
ncbi:unnamed protein product [Caenorhabditis angaria]|uniref:Ground-like domain-containing protein n=1 Tax=Caenorhabditis angaria TaxID=860376 RepID=A0A9P1N173_9PELO|nr:unnamed protein product [Caenorhabditis angaria]